MLKNNEAGNTVRVHFKKLHFGAMIAYRVSERFDKRNHNGTLNDP